MTLSSSQAASTQDQPPINVNKTLPLTRKLWLSPVMLHRKTCPTCKRIMDPGESPYSACEYTNGRRRKVRVICHHCYIDELLPLIFKFIWANERPAEFVQHVPAWLEQWRWIARCVSKADIKQGLDSMPQELADKVHEATGNYYRGAS